MPRTSEIRSCPVAAVGVITVALFVGWSTASQLPREAVPPTGGDVRMGLARDVELAALLPEISAERIRATDSTLVSFGTRHTMSDTISQTRGIGAARRWILAQLSSHARDCGGCLLVAYDTSTVVIERHPHKPAVMVANVVAWLPGHDTSRVVVMGGLARRDAASGGQQWNLTWRPVTGAVSYEVLVRRTTALSWEKIIQVGSATSFRLDEQLDDVWAAVRSVGSNGHRSLAAVLPAPQGGARQQ